jgi:hypothetical protein
VKHHVYASLCLLALLLSACDSDNRGGNNRELEDPHKLRLSERIVELQSNSARVPAHEALHELDDIEAEAQEAGFALENAVRDARLVLAESLGNQLREFHRELSESAEGARDREDWRRYVRYAGQLSAYLEVSEYRQTAAERLGISPASMRDTARRATHRLLAERLLGADEAVSRGDYAAAVGHLERVLRSAWLEDEVLEALEGELGEVRGRAERQEAGDLPPPRPAFSRSEAGIGDAGTSPALPRGERGAAATVNTLAARGSQLAKAGTLDLEVPCFGGTARALVESADNGLRFEVRRPAGEHEIHFVARPADLPAACRIAWMRGLPDIEPHERAALLVYAMNHGEMRTAGELAFALRRAEPEWREAVDGILAAKWGREVPEGGFPEADNRVLHEPE